MLVDKNNNLFPELNKINKEGVFHAKICIAYHRSRP
jgi:hypothetical protein